MLRRVCQLRWSRKLPVKAVASKWLPSKAHATQVLQSETGGVEGQYRFRDVDNSQDRSGEVVKASRQGRTLCFASSSCLALFRNFEVWCWDLRGSIREGEGVDHGTDQPCSSSVQSCRQ